MKRAICTLATLLLWASAAHADIVGWNFVTGFGGWPTTYNLGPAEVAGFTGFEQANWNNHVGAGQGPAPVPLNDLLDAGGASTTIDVTAFTLTANNSWNMQDSATPNARLVSDFADQQPSITFSNIGAPYTDSGYRVVVYYSNNEGPTQSTLSITGSADDALSRQIITGNTAQVSYSNVGWVEEAGFLAGPTNVTVFDALNDPEFTVALTGPANNGISAVQIVSGVAPPLPEGNAIGVNYVNGFFGSASALSPDESAGFLLVQEKWNNAQGQGQGPPNAPLNNLLDDNGNPSTADITAWTLSSNNSWRVDTGGSTDPNAKLNSDFNDREPSITFDEIPFDEYSVAVHYNNNEGPSTSTLTIDGVVDDSVSRLITSGNTGNTRWAENGYIEEDGTGVGPSNVTVFTGLNDPGFTLNLTGANNNGITAIQIVNTATAAVPEPATWLLATIGLLALVALGRRRRRPA
ncbi:MAG: PEP-CTERM sorting domain-containing protein [Planctomycetes bacterium]|nr:PEP-CTERM sorting domain-containing protein [Planctomycetota bacterium]